MQVIDTKGKLCPAPLILTKRAIKNAQIGTKFTVLCDNETAKNNLITYLSELEFTPSCRYENGVFNIEFKISNRETKDVKIGDFCSSSGYSIVLKSRLMGDGDPKLGAILMKAFVNSLIDCEILPKNIIIYNEGVMLALNGEDTAETLIKLCDKGVNVTVCGTCIDFYDVKSRLAVGTISNMYKITEILSQSSHVIYP